MEIKKMFTELSDHNFIFSIEQLLEITDEHNLHELKTHKKYFESIWNGKKTFELRKADRDYKIDDVLLLREYKPKYEKYTGRVVAATVTYILSDENFPEAIHPDYVVLAIATIAKEEHYQGLPKL